MFWNTRARTVGLLVAVPAIAATLVTLHWVLEPSRPTTTPVATVAIDLDRAHERVRSVLSVEDTLREHALGAAGLTEVPTIVGPVRSEEEPARVAFHRDGRQIGWVEVDRATLANVAAERLDARRRAADAAAAASEVQRERFAEAHALSLANARKRERGGPEVRREPSALARLIGTGVINSQGPRFQRLDFVQDLARERSAVRRASELRSQNGRGATQSRRR